MVAAGYTVHPARTGSNELYSWERSSYFVWEAGDPGAGPMAGNACRERFAPYREKTIEEQREIYDRWLLERQCLIGLGFSPALPPTFDEFHASWRTGPWMPIDGVPFNHLGKFQTDRCGLEMIE